MSTLATRAEDVRWDLSELARDADGARTEIAALVERAADFGERYRGRVGELDADGLGALLDEVDQLEQDRSRLSVYVASRLNLAATDPEANDLATFGRDRGAEIENSLVFFDVEWLALDDDAAEALLGSPQLAPYEHKLRLAREHKPYVLSEAEEQALNARRPAINAWQTLHDRHVATLEVPFDAGEGEEPHNLSRLLSHLHHPDREVRLNALTVLYEALEPRVDVLAACYDALVGDRLGIDRLRGYSDPMQPTNMTNELDGETVEAMMTATEESYRIGRRWFETKAGLLGLDKLALADQYAPISEARSFSWAEAVELVGASFTRFSPRLADRKSTRLNSSHR